MASVRLNVICSTCPLSCVGTARCTLSVPLSLASPPLAPSQTRENGAGKRERERLVHTRRGTEADGERGTAATPAGAPNRAQPQRGGEPEGAEGVCHSPTYFFSNSPVKCLLTKVVFPTPPSPTSTSLNCTSGPAGAPPCCIRHTGAQTERQICNGWEAAVQREPPALPLSVLALFKSSRHRRYLPLSLSLSLSPSLPLSLPPCLPLAVPPGPALPHCL